MNDEHHAETQGLFEATPVDINDICLHEEHCSQHYELVSYEGGQISHLPCPFQFCTLDVILNNRQTCMLKQCCFIIFILVFCKCSLVQNEQYSQLVSGCNKWLCSELLVC